MTEAGTGITKREVDEKARIAKLKPTEAEFIGRPGYSRKYRKNGSYKWKYDFTPNDGHGKLTREAEEVGDMMTPFNDAATEHQAAVQGRAPKAALRDASGTVQYVDPPIADATAARNGWRHHWRAGGLQLERGLQGGQLFRRLSGGWEPTGRTEAAITGALADKSVIHISPDGKPWRWSSGEWRKF